MIYLASHSHRNSIWQKPRDSYPFNLGRNTKLALHLATGGERERLLSQKLTRSLLALRQQPKDDGSIDSDSFFGYYPECQSLYEPHEYENILEEIVPMLARKLGEPVFLVLRDVLNAAMEICEDKSLSMERFYDTSYIWRPAIEDHEQNSEYSLRHFLVSTLRNISEKLIRTKIVSLERIIELLQEKEWPLFTRLSLHLLRLFPSDAENLVAEHLTNWEFFDHHVLHHEYVRLLQHSYNDLKPEKQQLILSWIENGPDLGKLEDSWRERTGEELPLERIRTFKRIWQRDYLCFISSHLPATWAEYYEELIAEDGLPEHPEFLAYSESFVGHISPLSIEELRTLSVPELLAYLNSWEPHGTWKSPSREGLARVLETYIAAEANVITRSLHLFEDVHPLYLEAIFCGLRRAVKDSRSVCWEHILDFTLLVTDPNSKLSIPISDCANSLPTVRPIRRIVADLICEGLKTKTNQIPFVLRNKVWVILFALSQDSNPTVDDEQGTYVDPMTLSVNSVRGQAFYAILAYAIWVHKRSEDLTSPQGFGIMPEVRAVLETHLDPNYEKSLAIRAIYGRSFPTLFAIDQRWAITHKQSIFSLEPELSAYLDTAWEAYITFRNPTEVMYDALEDYYHLAVSKLSIKGETTELSRSTQRLIEHIMQYYWHGKISLANDGIIDLFMSVQNQKAHSHAISYIGRTLGISTESLSAPVVGRLKQLWNQWVMCGEIMGETDELRSFGWWISAGGFEEEWSILQLEKTLRLTKGQVEDVYRVIGFLVKVAHKYPVLVIECLSSLLENDPKMDMYLFRENKVYVILGVIINSDVPEAKTRAITCVHRLGARGHKIFGELLSAE